MARAESNRWRCGRCDGLAVPKHHPSCPKRNEPDAPPPPGGWLTKRDVDRAVARARRESHLEIREVGGDDRSEVTVLQRVDRAQALKSCRETADVRRAVRGTTSEYVALLDGEEIGRV